MSSSADPLTQPRPLLHTIFERVLRTECLALEGLRWQLQGYNGLPGGGGEERLKAVEQRAYHRAEILLTQLLTTQTDSLTTPDGLPSSSQ